MWQVLKARGNIYIILKVETVFHSGQVWIHHQIHLSNSEGPESEACKRTHQYKTLFPDSLRAAVIQSVTVIQCQNVPNFV